jgi:hypothetical protein
MTSIKTGREDGKLPDHVNFIDGSFSIDPPEQSLLLEVFDHRHGDLVVSLEPFVQRLGVVVVTTGPGSTSELKKTRPAWAGFKTAEEGRTKIM